LGFGVFGRVFVPFLGGFFGLFRSLGFGGVWVALFFLAPGGRRFLEKGFFPLFFPFGGGFWGFPLALGFAGFFTFGGVFPGFFTFGRFFFFWV